MKKQLTYALCETKKQADKFCRRNHLKGAIVTPHKFEDGHMGFVIWYKY